MCFTLFGLGGGASGARGLGAAFMPEQHVSLRCFGLDEHQQQLYNFGETVSIVFWTDTWKPESFFDKITKNKKNGMHTLCLLEIGSLKESFLGQWKLGQWKNGGGGHLIPPVHNIKVKEQSLENLMRGKKIYEPPRYMRVNEAAEQLLAIVQNRRREGEEAEVTEDTICVGLARVGAVDQKIVSGTLQEMTTAELGGPLHSMIITGILHPLEIEMLKLFTAKSPI
ncbi:UNVERIFIED_CONTAM: diphthine synthase [Gekko kuhli]